MSEVESERFLCLRDRKKQYFCIFIKLKKQKVPEEKKLSSLRPGDSALIEGFTDSDLSVKFLEMGCLPGEKITLERVAPLGDPFIINVSGYLMTLRKSEAATIRIKPLP
jgi:ferrous iron transport protein A